VKKKGKKGGGTRGGKEGSLQNLTMPGSAEKKGGASTLEVTGGGRRKGSFGRRRDKEGARNEAPYQKTELGERGSGYPQEGG